MTKSILGGDTRDNYGLIVSCATEDYSEGLTFHRAGPQSETLAEIVGMIDALDGRWYIEAISNPESVYRDVIGQPSSPFQPERTALSKLGRLDLLRTPHAHEPSDSTKQVGHGWRGKRFVLPKDAA